MRTQFPSFSLYCHRLIVHYVEVIVVVVVIVVVLVIFCTVVVQCAQCMWNHSACNKIKCNFAFNLLFVISVLFFVSFIIKLIVNFQTVYRYDRRMICVVHFIKLLFEISRKSLHHTFSILSVVWCGMVWWRMAQRLVISQGIENTHENNNLLQLTIPQIFRPRYVKWVLN